MSTNLNLPKFKCHKDVNAAKIVSIGTSKDANQLALQYGDEFFYVNISKEYLIKHNPQIGGYYVRYEDGYESFSPAKVFEDGYTLID